MVAAPNLEPLRSGNVTEQVAALKQLKNDIVGHELRKETVVKQGLLEVLADVVRASSNGTGKRRRDGAPLLAVWTDEEEARLQAILVLASLANGGPAFVAPMIAATIPALLLGVLAVHNVPKLVTAALQALKCIVASWAAAQESTEGDAPALGIFDKDNSESFLVILRQPSASVAGRQQLQLVADIIGLAAITESDKAALVQSNVLDTLASLLASHAVASRHVEGHAAGLSLASAPPAVTIPSIIAAISTIISGSSYRTHRFFLSPVLRELFTEPRTGRSDRQHAFGPRFGFTGPEYEPLLPPVHVPAYGTTTYYSSPSRAFPAQAALQSQQRPRNGVYGYDVTPHAGDADHANAVCGWLLVLARSLQGHDRLTALKLLAQVNNAIDDDSVVAGHRSEHVQKTRERLRQLALLAVPLAVNLVQSAAGSKSNGNHERDARLIKEDACEVLALLICSSKELQAAAVECGAIKHVCPLLKKTFDSVTLSMPMWSASKNDTADGAQTPDTRKMGARGLHAEVLHVMKIRQGALHAIAAMAAIEDIHRKAIVDAGVVPAIIESLKLFPSTMPAKGSGRQQQLNVTDGNTVPVIMAACYAAKCMSRSVSLLRTSLIDAGIAKPIASLLKHPTLNVQLAATDVCANLLMDFSPMRETLVEEGVIRVLTEHARTSSNKLKLSSLWALKHLVLQNKREIKVNTFEELSAVWIVSAIQGDQEKAPHAANGGGVSITNAAGEQVDLLNPASTSMDVDEDEPIDEDEEGLRSTLHPTSSTLAFNSKRYLSSVRELEQNPALQAKRDDIAVQEQALDFVRNLLNGDEDNSYMLDHMLQAIGTTKFFEILTARLQPLPYSARLSTSSPARQVYQPIEIISSTIHILVHIANATPRHKQLLIAQKPLLNAWLPHFTHIDRRVRSLSVWCVSNLTWIEDDSDKKEARQRALELRSLGIEAEVRKLAQDLDLDVKERVKTAVRQFEQLL
ncbi:ARM repeat-containing protein [Teratosphaeria nubilosa]|uniref:ARM repeat-containing protein n=1 Tax=Teratosphaeria nubilosa TaxID=161662 RepID=A0A6G1L3S4_9PEZI|nr:ARM repeat-containing protein [Teratosphaeria nubilosa]